MFEQSGYLNNKINNSNDYHNYDRNNTRNTDACANNLLIVRDQQQQQQQQQQKQQQQYIRSQHQEKNKEEGTELPIVYVSSGFNNLFNRDDYTAVDEEDSVNSSNNL